MPHPPPKRDPARRRVEREILAAPLLAPPGRCSSRVIADQLGVSQSRVARTWAPMRARTRLTDALDGLVGDRPIALAGMLVQPGSCLLVLAVPEADLSSPAMQALQAVAGTQRWVLASPSVRQAARAVLGADVVRAELRVVDAGAGPDFWARVLAGAAGHALVGVRSGDPHPEETYPPAAQPHRAGATDGVPILTCSGAEWLSLWGFVEGRRLLRPETWSDLAAALRRWARAPVAGLSWVAGSDSTDPPPPAVPRRSTRHPGPERALADEVVSALRAGVREGRIAVGARVTEHSLATRLHTTRGQVRAAVRLLERDGLLTIASGSGAVIAMPEAADVVEIYAARAALGAMVVRAATRWTDPARSAVAATLAELAQHAAAGDVTRVGDLDMAFQDALADASGLVRITPMLHVLADQLRMFIAVMGLEYDYPADLILRDDTAIFEAIDSGDGDRAVALWRTKMQDARAYMLAAFAAPGRPLPRP